MTKRVTKLFRLRIHHEVTAKQAKRAEATKATRAMLNQLSARKADLGAELATACGMSFSAETEKTLPAWVRKAIRLFASGDATFSEDPAHSLGAFLGVAAASEAALGDPSETVAADVRRIPQLGAFLQSMRLLLQSSWQLAGNIQRAVQNQSMTAKECKSVFMGQAAGADSVLDDNGELDDKRTIKGRICLWLWLYWKEIQRLDSSSELRAFLLSLGQDDVSEKNLQKICVEVGLKFRACGRPKKIPTKRVAQVGIQKRKTVARSGHDKSRTSEQPTGKTRPFQRRSR